LKEVFSEIDQGGFNQQRSEFCGKSKSISKAREFEFDDESQVADEKNTRINKIGKTI
jgi:lipopolysaccharide/colanic/teichoic acid biosynthesis glycosyltransferase